jgi:hypothetical protein
MLNKFIGMAFPASDLVGARQVIHTLTDNIAQNSLYGKLKSSFRTDPASICLPDALQYVNLRVFWACTLFKNTRNLETLLFAKEWETIFYAMLFWNRHTS